MRFHHLAATVIVLVSGACGASTQTPGSSPVIASPLATPSAASTVTDWPLTAEQRARLAEAMGIMEAMGEHVPPTSVPQFGMANDPLPALNGLMITINASPVVWDPWVVSWDSQGTMHSVRHLGSSGFGEAPLPGEQLLARATALVRALGTGLAEPSSMEPDENGWVARWSLSSRGVDIEAASAVLRLGIDGSLVEFTRNWTTLAPAPATTIPASQATAMSGLCKTKTESAQCTARLVWHRPVQSAVSVPLRLCWQIASGETELVWLDAGTGEQVDAQFPVFF